MIVDKMFPALENLLSLTSKRQQALTSNVANMDTPGYHAKDFSFSEQLNAINVATTSPNHIALTADSASNIRMFEVEATEKPNGNNVDLEHELTEITKNGLQYITLVEDSNQNIRTLSMSITEGGRV